MFVRNLGPILSPGELALIIYISLFRACVCVSQGVAAKCSGAKRTDSVGARGY